MTKTMNDPAVEVVRRVRHEISEQMGHEPQTAAWPLQAVGGRVRESDRPLDRGEPYPIRSRSAVDRRVLKPRTTS